MSIIVIALFTLLLLMNFTISYGENVQNVGSDKDSEKTDKAIDPSWTNNTKMYLYILLGIVVVLGIVIPLILG